MKIKIGDPVETLEFGDGPVVAMSEEWCVILTNPTNSEGFREVAVPWDQVYLSAEPESTQSSIESKEV